MLIDTLLAFENKKKTIYIFSIISRKNGKISERKLNSQEGGWADIKKIRIVFITPALQ